MSNVYAIKANNGGFLAVQGETHWLEDTPKGWALFTTEDGARRVAEDHHSACGGFEITDTSTEQDRKTTLFREAPIGTVFTWPDDVDLFGGKWRKSDEWTCYPASLPVDRIDQALYPDIDTPILTK